MKKAGLKFYVHPGEPQLDLAKLNADLYKIWEDEHYKGGRGKTKKKGEREMSYSELTDYGFCNGFMVGDDYLNPFTYGDLNQIIKYYKKGMIDHLDLMEKWHLRTCKQ
jgi:hypothetical protein